MNRNHFYGVALVVTGFMLEVIGFPMMLAYTRDAFGRYADAEAQEVLLLACGGGLAALGACLVFAGIYLAGQERK